METVLITGAAGGLGRALVEAFLGAGHRVVAGWHSSPFPDWADLSGDRFLALPLDVGDSGSVERALAEVCDHWGGVDVLVNNAGIRADKPFWNLDPSEWDALMNTNLTGTFRCCRVCAAGMAERGRGHIINIASHVGRLGGRGQAAYAASKAGIIGLTQSLAAELGPMGVPVNAVLPGVLPTRMTGDLPEPVLSAMRQRNVLGRLGDAREVASFVAFLASGRAVSGQVFAWDGRPLRAW
jgi:3-oxoacyl-[acyl-carrier protein] reductase